MNVVDSDAWLEYCANGPNASFVTPPIEDLERLIVPSATIHAENIAKPRPGEVGRHDP